MFSLVSNCMHYSDVSNIDNCDIFLSVVYNVQQAYFFVNLSEFLIVLDKIIQHTEFYLLISG